MKSEIEPVIRSASLLGHTLLVILVVLVAAVAVVIIWLAVDPQLVGRTLSAGVGYESDALRSWQNLALTLILLIQIGIWIAVVYRGRQIFIALTKLIPDDASIAAGKTARLLWILLVWGIVGHMVATVVATWHFPAGTRALGVTLGSAEISTTLAALLATFSSRAFVLGAALWQDHQEVI